jgi:D-tyrosyl-tRNA(Tyr) deacylase
MRLVIQRVSQASVSVEDNTIGSIGNGLLVLIGVRAGDDEETAQKLADKTAELRIFPDEGGRFNRSLVDVAGEALVVSQFTLYGDTRRGRRPSFNDAAKPSLAEPLISAYVWALAAHGIRVANGRFGAHMQVSLLNDGPVTIIIDSDELEAPRRTKDSETSVEESPETTP